MPSTSYITIVLSLSLFLAYSQFVAHVIADVLAELQERGTFHSLLFAVGEEKRRKANLLDIIIRSGYGQYEYVG